jgi:hypothetical protein
MKYYVSCERCGAPAKHGPKCDTCLVWDSDMRRHRRALGPAERQSAPIVRLVWSTTVTDRDKDGR